MIVLALDLSTKSSGYAVFDEREKDNRYPSLNWARLSEIDLAWYKGDEEK